MRQFLGLGFAVDSHITLSSCTCRTLSTAVPCNCKASVVPSQGDVLLCKCRVSAAQAFVAAFQVPADAIDSFGMDEGKEEVQNNGGC